MNILSVDNLTIGKFSGKRLKFNDSRHEKALSLNFYIGSRKKGTISTQKTIGCIFKPKGANLTIPTQKTIVSLNYTLKAHEKDAIPTRKTITAPTRVHPTLQKTP